jgi:predicted small integral membrane protein
LDGVDHAGGGLLQLHCADARRHDGVGDQVAQHRRGFLPIATTRGDRLFIGLLTAAYINLAFVGLAGKFAEWFSLEAEPSVWISFVLSMGVLALVMKKG